MHYKSLEIDGSLLLENDVYKDIRGVFTESFNANMRKVLKCDFIQDNIALSKKKYTFRGLHYQAKPYDQKKLIRVLKGEIFDILYDLRKKSPSYRKKLIINLKDDFKQSLYIPNGVAHGYITLVKDTIVTYKVDKKYSPKHEKGINLRDINFDFEKVNLKYNKLVISDRDRSF